MDLGKKNTQSLYLFTVVPFLWGIYIQNTSRSRGDSSTRSWRQPARWSARPRRDSWLMSSWLGEPCGDTEAAGRLLRLEHMSYRLPENCIFLDSWRRDSQTAAASSGQPAIATLAQSWNSSHDLKKRRGGGDRWRRTRTSVKHLNRQSPRNRRSSWLNPWRSKQTALKVTDHVVAVKH